MRVFLPWFAIFAVACHDLTPRQQARLDKFECQAAALAPLVEPIYDATDLLRAARAGEADINQVLRALAVAEDEVRALVSRLEGCDGEAPAPALEAN